MRKVLLFAIVLIGAVQGFGQVVKAPGKHVDTVYGYEVAIPAWWKIRETPSNLFGGTLPEISSIENALIFKSFGKDKFKDMKAFEAWLIREYKSGDSPKWGPESMILDVKDNNDFKKVGNAWNVHVLNGETIYDCLFIATQSKNAFIWIDFTSTANTYKENLPKFKEVVNSFKIL